MNHVDVNITENVHANELSIWLNKEKMCEQSTVNIKILGPGVLPRILDRGVREGSWTLTQFAEKKRKLIPFFKAQTRKITPFKCV